MTFSGQKNLKNQTEYARFLKFSDGKNQETHALAKNLSSPTLLVNTVILF